MVRGTFSPARAWRLAVGPASTRTLGLGARLLLDALYPALPGRATANDISSRSNAPHCQSARAPERRRGTWTHSEFPMSSKEDATRKNNRGWASAERAPAYARSAGLSLGSSRLALRAAVLSARQSVCWVRRSSNSVVGGKSGKPKSAASGAPTHTTAKPRPVLVGKLTHKVQYGAHRWQRFTQPRPNPSVEARPNGVAPGPRSGKAYHPLRGPGATPLVPPHLER